MQFIMIPAIFGIVTLGIYKFSELIICRKERLIIIEKMGEKFSPDMLGKKINFSSVGNLSFSALKFGCLLTGLGLGLLVGYLICTSTLAGYAEMSSDYFNRSQRETISVIYGACVLLFGGAGLLTSFLIELKTSKK